MIELGLSTFTTTYKFLKLRALSIIFKGFSTVDGCRRDSRRSCGFCHVVPVGSHTARSSRAEVSSFKPLKPIKDDDRIPQNPKQLNSPPLHTSEQRVINCFLNKSWHIFDVFQRNNKRKNLSANIRKVTDKKTYFLSKTGSSLKNVGFFVCFLLFFFWDGGRG